MKDWILSSEKKPDFYQEVEVSDDGVKIEGKLVYLERRTCMMAGVAGGNGYFGEGFATTGEDTDYGLICDEPKYWRPIN